MLIVIVAYWRHGSRKKNGFGRLLGACGWRSFGPFQLCSRALHGRGEPLSDSGTVSDGKGHYPTATIAAGRDPEPKASGRRGEVTKCLLKALGTPTSSQSRLPTLPATSNQPPESGLTQGQRQRRAGRRVSWLLLNLRRQPPCGVRRQMSGREEVRSALRLMLCQWSRSSVSE
jgi:hypothetical protein